MISNNMRRDMFIADVVQDFSKNIQGGFQKLYKQNSTVSYMVKISNDRKYVSVQEQVKQSNSFMKFFRRFFCCRSSEKGVDTELLLHGNLQLYLTYLNQC